MQDCQQPHYTDLCAGAAGIYGNWQATLNRIRDEHPMVFPERDDVIIPQRAVQVRAPGNPVNTR